MTTLLAPHQTRSEDAAGTLDVLGIGTSIDFADDGTPIYNAEARHEAFASGLTADEIAAAGAHKVTDEDTAGAIGRMRSHIEALKQTREAAAFRQTEDTAIHAAFKAGLEDEFAPLIADAHKQKDSDAFRAIETAATTLASDTAPSDRTRPHYRKSSVEVATELRNVRRASAKTVADAADAPFDATKFIEMRRAERQLAAELGWREAEGRVR